MVTKDLPPELTSQRRGNGTGSTLVFVNVDYLGKIFKKEMGINFNQYLVKKRMEKVKQMLGNAEGSKSDKIAEAVGFGDNSRYFSQVFRGYTGVSRPTTGKAPRLKKTVYEVL